MAALAASIRTGSRLQDVLLAVLFSAVDLAFFSYLLGVPAMENAEKELVPLPVLLLYGLAEVAALIFRRRHPVIVFCLLWLHSVIALQIPMSGYRPTVGLVVALYSVASRRQVMPGILALFSCFVPEGMAIADEVVRNTAGPRQAGVALGNAIFYTVLNVGIWSIGRWVRASRVHAAMLERRRRVAAQEAVAAERLRIARELHDIVAHGVTVMVLQAAGAKRIAARDPARVHQALSDIEHIGGQAMGELRRMLSALRDGERDDGVGTQPDLSDIDDLIAHMQGAGLQVELTRVDPPEPVDRSVEVTAYRIIQEALTNVAKYAGHDCPTTVLLGWENDQLLVEIANRESGRPRLRGGKLSTGHGLLGLRERVHVIGGTFNAGPLPAGGFRVRALLPNAHAHEPDERPRSVP
ncbi:sensor histidine kinase [Nonomuraea sp. NPDC050394]|uniref:sensor histidine kinase n=1 Tax=Nonomuraea sp. NPDC050394 TaxID=3364363 RepID=UPI00379A8F9D